jgi:hypothetical protein
MRKFLLFIFFCFLLVSGLFAQSSSSTGSGSLSTGQQNITDKKVVYVSPCVKAVKIDDRFGVADSVQVDTIPIDFPDKDPISSYSIANSYNGNLVSPLQSKIFFDRTQKTDFLFSTPYDAYYYAPSDFYFYNTKTPFTSVTYMTSYPAQQAEERTKILMSMNANKRLNITGLFDYPYARGNYTNQSAKGLVAALYGSYIGKHYSAYGALSYQRFDNYENGGLENTAYVTDPAAYSQYTSITMPVNLSGALSSYQSTTLFYNHKYSIGFTKTIQVKKDSVREEYIPVTSFIHTLKVQSDIKRFREIGVDTVFFKDTKMSKTNHSDTIAYLSIRNTFAVQMDEKFNRLLKFGLTAFVENEVNRYMNMLPTQIQSYAYGIPLSITKPDTYSYNWEQNTRIGGVLSKHEGSAYKYDLQGDLVAVGPRIGDFELSGKVAGNFSLWNDSVALKAKVRISSTSPSYYWDHYYSNHFIWDNDFNKQYQTYMGGSLELPKQHVKVELQVANNTNYLYFNQSALPAQYGGSVQVVALDASIDFHVGHFVLENKGVYQMSSDQVVLPLPQLSLYNNLYYLTRLFKVLQVQLGASCRYNTAYYAPAYEPATGQFYVQNSTKIGNYPLVNVYANFHLKQCRFFVEYYNVSQSFMTSQNYFSMPDYPLNPMIMKIGISVNWYN